MIENKKPVNVKDVAKLANVSLASVDRVLHNRPGVSAKTKEKVHKAIKKLNYQPNILASNLSKKKTYVFGALLPRVSSQSSYWGLPLKGIQKADKELDQYAVKVKTFLYDQGEKNEIRAQILKIINSNIDGLVLTPKFADDTEILLQDCNEKQRPYVFIDSNNQDKKSLCSIEQPLYESGQLAGQLFSFGFQKGKILILHFKDAMDSNVIINTKIKGIVDFLKEVKSNISIMKIVISDFDQKSIKTIVDKALSDNPDVNGVFIPNSKIGLIAKYFESKNENKIQLIGYDYLDENCGYIENDIIDFLICQKPEWQGYQAIQKLFKHLVLKRDVKQKVIVPLDIITKKNYKFY